MKTLLLSATLAALALGPLPAAADLGTGTWLAGAPAFSDAAPGDDLFDRRGRGRGRGGDDRLDDRRGGDGGHGGRPRVPGGSGCDDPHDLIEHPECRA
jgi:hypothetical protein